jgi:hypothetical protein
MIEYAYDHLAGIPLLQLDHNSTATPISMQLPRTPAHSSSGTSGFGMAPSCPTGGFVRRF